MANSVDPDEAAHHELPHQDLCCLQIQLFFTFGILILKDTFFSLYEKGGLHNHLQ